MAPTHDRRPPPPPMAAALFLIAGAGCATAAPQPQGAAAATVALERTAALGGVEVTPLRIEEDSRCPTGVQCIQAGTVRVAVRIGARSAGREAVLTLARPLPLAGGERLTLCAVSPYPKHPGAIAPSAYRFSFALDRAAGPACAQ